MYMKRLGTGEKKILIIHEPAAEQGIWRIRTNKGLRELYEDLNIVADINTERVGWNGHVVRMDQGRTVKKVYENKLEQSRRGRPKLRWLEDVEKDLW
jgi:hypothetical protein